MKTFLDPQDVLKQIKIKEEMIIADFGCGSGGWVLPLARQLEEKTIYAVDVLKQALSILKSRVVLEKLSDIKPILNDVEKGVDISSDCCDLVLMTNLLFQVDDKESVFKEAKRVSRNGGQILVVDWKKDSALGPKEGKVSIQEVKSIAQKTGFKFDKEIDAGNYHYGLLFIK